MTVKLIVHPHQRYDINRVFLEKANEIAEEENAFTIVDPRKESYVENPRNYVESISGKITKEMMGAILEDEHTSIMGGFHGKCPYDTLDSVIMLFIAGSQNEKMVIDFPMDFIYCRICDYQDIPVLDIGQPEEEIVGEWTSYIANAENEPGRKRIDPYNQQFVPIFNNSEVSKPGSYILGGVLKNEETPLETFFLSYINLANRWVKSYTYELLKRADKKGILRGLQFCYETTYDPKINSFVFNLRKGKSIIFSK